MRMLYKALEQLRTYKNVRERLKPFINLSYTFQNHSEAIKKTIPQQNTSEFQITPQNTSSHNRTAQIKTFRNLSKPFRTYKNALGCRSKQENIRELIRTF